MRSVFPFLRPLSGGVFSAICIKRGAQWMKKEVTAVHNNIRPLDSTTPLTNWPEHHDNSQPRVPADHFVVRDGVQFAGTHLILDFWGAKKLDDLQIMELALRECVTKCGASLLHIHLHHFTPNGGISAVAVLAESHISVHTWPERDFAAFDIFMCGNAHPEEAIAILMRAFSPKTINITENLRGIVENG
jgi:S-adenosylmethionine decarboxylase